MKVSFLNVPSWAHQGEYRINGNIYQGQIGIFSDTTGSALQNGADATYTMYEQRAYLKPITAAAQVTTDTTGAVQFFIVYKWPNADEYEDAAHAYGQKILHDTPIVAVPLINGFRIEDYDTQDNTSGLDSAVTWATVAPGTLMYINSSGRWTTTYAAASTTIAYAVFERYANHYVTYRIMHAANFHKDLVGG